MIDADVESRVAPPVGIARVPGVVGALEDGSERRLVARRDSGMLDAALPNTPAVLREHLGREEQHKERRHELEARGRHGRHQVSGRDEAGWQGLNLQRAKRPRQHPGRGG
jgi:hypothetical protein